MCFSACSGDSCQSKSQWTTPCDYSLQLVSWLIYRKGLVAGPDSSHQQFTRSFLRTPPMDLSQKLKPVSIRGTSSTDRRHIQLSPLISLTTFCPITATVFTAILAFRSWHHRSLFSYARLLENTSHKECAPWPELHKYPTFANYNARSGRLRVINQNS